VPVLAAVYALALGHLVVRGTVRMFDVAVLVAMYSAVKYAPHPRWGYLAGAGGAAGVAVAAATEQRNNDNGWTVFAVVGAVTVAVWVTAYGVRTRRLYIASLEERAATLERERDHLARLAAADERAAIAREIHDVIAHSLSVMIVQADGAGYTLDPSAKQAHAALTTIADTGREALTDMRRVLSVLRGPDGGRRRDGLAELDGVVDRAGAAGLRVTLETTGATGGLTAAEDLTAYRIVQESVTNAIRHAGPGATLALRLDRAADCLTITATNSGGRDGPTAHGAGHGLVGMRERAAMHGGSFTAGRLDDGGWRVTATIPLAPTAVAADAGGRGP
jgi:signal transduction histidine kinase